MSSNLQVRTDLRRYAKTPAQILAENTVADKLYLPIDTLEGILHGYLAFTQPTMYSDNRQYGFNYAVDCFKLFFLTTKSIIDINNEKLPLQPITVYLLLDMNALGQVEVKSVTASLEDAQNWTKTQAENAAHKINTTTNMRVKPEEIRHGWRVNYRDWVYRQMILRSPQGLLSAWIPHKEVPK